MKKDFLYVILQFILFGLYFFPWNYYTFLPLEWLVYLGLIGIVGSIIIMLFGILNLSEDLSPFTSPKDDAGLIQTGIYKYIRHPIYSGLMLGMCSYAIYLGSVEKLTISIIMAVVFYFKSNYEERLLIRKYASYTQYKNITGRFFPKRLK